MLFVPPALIENSAPPPPPPPPLPLPAPQAAIQEAEREIALAGFNGVELKASVLGGPSTGQATGQAGALFAVMVAGAGPADRNWFSTALKDPATGKPLQSHGGRDLARWFQARGIGSLRYDKRFVTRRDPGLDVSLDAQLGDLKAALAATRKLPEARGRRLLLVGHDEGALLSLMAAGEADALLLLAMPAASQASVIREQVQALVPPAQAGPDLAYLEQVFEAIRKGQALPEAGEGVHPFMLAMGRSMMASETLDFVRALLDLDPWVLASHLALPAAAAWGDRDIQTPRPAKIPAAFRGAVLEIGEANHLLKRESRPRASLRPGAAIAAYGDDTPMTDLGVIEAWIRTLK